MFDDNKILTGKLKNMFAEHMDVVGSNYNSYTYMENNFVNHFGESLDDDETKLNAPNVGVVMNIYNDIIHTIQSNPLVPKLLNADKPADVPYYQDLKFLSNLANTSIKAIDETINTELVNFKKLWDFINAQWSSLIEYSKDSNGKRKPFILETLLIMITHHAELLVRELILFINTKFKTPEDTTSFSATIDKNVEFKDVNRYVKYVNDNIGELKKLTSKDRISKLKKDKRTLEETMNISQILFDKESMEESMAMVSNIVDSKVIYILGIIESYSKAFKDDVHDLFNDMINKNVNSNGVLLYLDNLKNVLQDSQNALVPDMIKSVQKTSIKYTNLYNKTKTKYKPKKITVTK